MVRPSYLNLTGVIPPMITPLTQDGELDREGLKRVVANLLAGGVTGIFVLGSAGEGPWLTTSLRRQVVQHTVEAVAGQVPVLAGALESGTARTIEAVRLVADAGADAAVVTSPYYFPVDDFSQIKHFQAVADASDLPLILYNIPQFTHNALSPQTVGRLLGLQKIVAIKDSAGNKEDFEQLLELKGVEPRFSVLQGAEKLAARSVLAGADGIVPGLANLMPGVFSRLFACAHDEDDVTSLSLQERINNLWELHTRGFWLACLKYGASVLGLCGGTTYGPSQPLSESAKAAIRELIDNYGPSKADDCATKGLHRQT